MTPDRLDIPGLERPLRLYQFADLHLQAGADRDPQVPEAWRTHPSPRLPLDARELVATHLDRAVLGKADLILACGDLCHFPSAENAHLLTSAFRNCPVPVLPLPGNHDWFYPGQDGWEDLRTLQLPRLETVYGQHPSFGSRTLHGLQLLHFDNSTYFLNADQEAFLQEKLEAGLPTLVLLHIPVSTPSLRQMTLQKHGSPILMADRSGRVREGIDPAPTARMVELFRHHPAIQAVLAAHVHFPFREDLAPGRPQLIPDAGYRHGYRWIECLPA